MVERYHWVWIWMGDPALADPAKITDFHWLDDPNWGAKTSYLHVEANWQLVVDNLLDLTHLAFVHETTIGNMALVEHAAVKVQRQEDNVVVTRWIIDQPAPPTFVKVGKFTGNVDRWQIIDYTPPAFLRLDVGATPTGTGAPEGRRVNGIGMRNLNAITPETETTSHYFWGQAHDFDVKNPETTERVFQQIQTAFLEDVAVFTAQQRVDHACGRTRRRSTSMPTPAASRPAASSIGSIATSRRSSRRASRPNSGHGEDAAFEFPRRTRLAGRRCDAASSMYLTSDGRVILQGRAVSPQRAGGTRAAARCDMISVDRNAHPRHQGDALGRCRAKDAKCHWRNG